MKAAQTNTQGLRTDIPLLGGQEANDWINTIIHNTNYLDLLNLYEHLANRLESNRLAILFDKIIKMCDKCGINYLSYSYSDYLAVFLCNNMRHVYDSL
jgi:hypothetical protein